MAASIVTAFMSIVSTLLKFGKIMDLRKIARYKRKRAKCKQNKNNSFYSVEMMKN